MSEISKSDLGIIEERLPVVIDQFENFNHIGSGTFSKVYVANIKWGCIFPMVISSEFRRGSIETTTIGNVQPILHALIVRVAKNLVKKSSLRVAIKVITPTSDPNRVYREINFLRRSDGKCNIIPILTSFVNPHHGTAAIIMPFIKHKSFSDYFNKLNLKQIRNYMKALLTSLSHLHKLNILHRDIKPPNFLFDPETNVARLVDFGLSEDISPEKLRDSNRYQMNNFFCRCNHTQVCQICSTQKRSMKASRAGTGGFRPPEVLLKSSKQDQKIDVWAAGVCLIIVLARRYPYFPAVDDNIALSHIAALLGSAGLKDAAQSLGRRLTIAELPESTEPVQQIVKQQRLSSKIMLDEDKIETTGSEWREVTDLLIQLLQPNPKNRPNACQALDMEFFTKHS